MTFLMAQKLHIITINYENKHTPLELGQFSSCVLMFDKCLNAFMLFVEASGYFIAF